MWNVDNVKSLVAQGGSKRFCSHQKLGSSNGFLQRMPCGLQCSFCRIGKFVARKSYFLYREDPINAPTDIKILCTYMTNPTCPPTVPPHGNVSFIGRSFHLPSTFWNLVLLLQVSCLQQSTKTTTVSKFHNYRQNAIHANKKYPFLCDLQV